MRNHGSDALVVRMIFELAGKEEVAVYCQKHRLRLVSAEMCEAAGDLVALGGHIFAVEATTEAIR